MEAVDGNRGLAAEGGVAVGQEREAVTLVIVPNHRRLARLGVADGGEGGRSGATGRPKRRGGGGGGAPADQEERRRRDRGECGSGRIPG